MSSAASSFVHVHLCLCRHHPSPGALSCCPAQLRLHTSTLCQVLLQAPPCQGRQMEISWGGRSLWFCCPAWYVLRVLRLAERQVVIMLTPVRSIFHCEQQTGYEWLFAALAGAGSLLVAFATKLLTRCALAPHSGDCPACSLTTHSIWLIDCMPGDGHFGCHGRI